ncbi:MAG: nitroreductase family protein [Ilumatobacteraceae bacterium]
MSSLLPLGPDDLLGTTRAVRRRLDLDRPVDDTLIVECLELAQQSPSGSNNPKMHFVVVRDPDLRAVIGDVYRRCYDIYRQLPGVYIRSIDKGSDEANAQQQRSADSADVLATSMAQVPVLVIGCVEGRIDANAPGFAVASSMGNILPAMWSFMLAARARGLGTCWTTLHLIMEEEVAGILGIPFADVQQVCLTPVAHTVGTDFRRAARPPASTITHWDGW